MGDTGCSAPSTQYATATADSWTDQNSPNANNGTAADLRVKAKSATEARRAFFKFSLPTIPGDCSLSSATLWLNYTSAQGTRTFDVHRAAASWSENTITWANQPGLAGTPVSTTTSGTGWKSWVVTGLVMEQYSGSNDGLVLKDSVEDSGGSSFEQRVESREAGTPVIVIVIN